MQSHIGLSSCLPGTEEYVLAGTLCLHAGHQTLRIFKLMLMQEALGLAIFPPTKVAACIRRQG